MGQRQGLQAAQDEELIFTVGQVSALADPQPWFVHRNQTLGGLARSAFQFLEAVYENALAHFVQGLQPVASPRLAVRLPTAFAGMICSGHWDCLVLPNSKFSALGFRRAFTSVWPRGEREFRPPDCDRLPRSATFDSTQALSLAEDLRHTMMLLPRQQAAGHQMSERLGMWVQRLQNMSDITNQSLASQAGTHKRAMYLVETLLIVESASSESCLRDLLKHVCKLLFPADVSMSMAERIDASHVCAPGQLSQGRLLADIACMTYWRRRNRADMTQGCVRYMMVDSSPQYKRDYEIVLIKSIRIGDLESLLEKSLMLETLWTDGVCGDVVTERFSDAALRESESAAIASMRLCIYWHTPPLTHIGMGASTLAHKVHAALHSMRLELFTGAELQKYVREIFCSLTDFGTEYGMYKLKPIANPFPYWVGKLETGETAPQLSEVAYDMLQDVEGDCDHFDILEEAADHTDIVQSDGVPMCACAHCEDVCFEHMFGNDGLLHTIHNRTTDLSKCLSNRPGV